MRLESLWESQKSRLVSLEIVTLLGPTASGKSVFAIELATALGRLGVPVQIVNGDAMQLYRHMNIATAKVPDTQRQGIEHHLIDLIEPAEEFTASQYRGVFDDIINSLQEQGILPLVVGGSMFYISAALDELDFSATDPQLRSELEGRLALEGPGFLIEELRKRDPASLAHIPAANTRRLLRALEVNLLTGEPYRHSLPTPKFRRPTLQYGLSVSRQELVTRIDKRVYGMWQQGLLAEVEAMRSRGIRLGRTAAKAIGYQQVIAQLDGTLTQQQAIEETQRLTRRYARRQMSWFRRDQRTTWLETSTPEDVARQIRLAL